RVSATVAVASDGGDTLRYRVDASSYTVMEIPVLNRRVRRGEKIENGDVVWMEVRQDSAGRNIVLDRDAIVGQAARRFLAENRPINIDDIEPPVLVSKGSLVTMYFETGQLMLTAKARASDDGAMNDTIRVVNITSKRTVEAVVRGPTAVMVPNGMRFPAN
ncbi:MAG: flagellar basal body P-ring formation chaperone FlgA, partial [Rhodospirillaceae bacterium]